MTGIVFEPVYGWSLLVEAFEQIQALHPNAGLVIMGEGREMSACRELVQSKHLDGRVLLTGDLVHPTAVTLCREFADVMVRPTLVDGDSTFVREGIALKVPIVASNTDFRPEGTILFEKGNARDLADKIQYSLLNEASIKRRLKSVEHPDNFQKTLEIIESNTNERTKDARNLRSSR